MFGPVKFENPEVDIVEVGPNEYVFRYRGKEYNDPPPNVKNRWSAERQAISEQRDKEREKAYVDSRNQEAAAGLQFQETSSLAIPAI